MGGGGGGGGDVKKLVHRTIKLKGVATRGLYGAEPPHSFGKPHPHTCVCMRLWHLNTYCIPPLHCHQETLIDLTQFKQMLSIRDECIRKVFLVQLT